MVHITYRHGPYSNEQNGVILKYYHFYISNDRCHDLAYIQHCFQFFYNHIKEKNIHMDKHCIWSYGCACQLKNSHLFQWLCMLHKKLNVPHICNYFEYKHGKGEHDGASACIKTVLCGPEMKFTNTSLIPNSKSIVEWCSSIMGEGAGTREDQSHKKGHVHRYFLEVVVVDRS
jgi:hypothetical protein